ncbi:MAG TPA: glycoside hydrolase family 27 protein [Candidatus Scybalocola faecavium]|nr:glycoside hydrolase family 27 protein [Candidatus Scybalocola faecavium]
MNKEKFLEMPPRGWNSYDYYDTTVTEEEVRDNARVMAEKLLPFGYEYVVVDIQWYACDAGTRRKEYQYVPFGDHAMDDYGRFIPCPDRFPSSRDGQGFKPLADYVHSLGLKFGIHIMRGIPRAAAHGHLPVAGTNITAAEIADPGSICDWNPDMYGLRDCPESQAYYDSIFQLYASWGVDFIKCDDICNTHAYKDRPYMGKHEVEMIRKAINKCGRPMVLSLSPGPALLGQSGHYCKWANMWRMSDDFWDSWPLLKSMFVYCERWQHVKEPGCWPDCDMLPVGMIGRGFLQERMTRFTKDEQKTMFALWCIFKSPLMAGACLTKLDDWTLELLTNWDLLKLQDPDYDSCEVVLDDDHAVWFADSRERDCFTAAVFNLSDTTSKYTLDLKVLDRFSRLDLLQKDVQLWDIYGQKCLDLENGCVTVTVPAHGTVVLEKRSDLVTFS